MSSAISVWESHWHDVMWYECWLPKKFLVASQDQELFVGPFAFSYKVKDGELIDLGCLSYHNNLCTGWFRAGMNWMVVLPCSFFVAFDATRRMLQPRQSGVEIGCVCVCHERRCAKGANTNILFTIFYKLPANSIQFTSLPSRYWIYWINQTEYQWFFRSQTISS